MQPTLKDGQYTLLKKENCCLSIDDLIVFQRDDRYLVKRIVGHPGDTFLLSQSGIFRNGILLSPYSYDGSEKKYTLTHNQYFVIGDNHLFSEDSRHFGPVIKDHILGVLTLY